MAIIINGTSIEDNQMIDFEIDSTVTVQLPEWLNHNAALNENLFNRKLSVINYTFRLTDSQRYNIDKSLLGHNTFTLVDTLYGISSTVWIKAIEVNWNITNYLYPWKLNLIIYEVEVVP